MFQILMLLTDILFVSLFINQMLIVLGIPCQHVCASMRVNGLMSKNYVNDFYEVETF